MIIGSGGIKMSVLRLDVTHRAPYEGGRSFGKTGPYVYIEGIAHFEIDPLDDANQGVTDIDLDSIAGQSKTINVSDPLIKVAQGLGIYVGEI